jgi:gamma-glutamylcyclotransferase (GGCT)/AIG2-like uncharacterized protein YtfP
LSDNLPTDGVTSIFAYGILRQHRSGAAQALDEAGAVRIPGALARATAPPSSALSFEGRGDREVPGELIRLPAGTAEALLAKLDEYEGPDYERVLTRVRVAREEPIAWVYQHRSSPPEAGRAEQMLTAACRKLEIAQYHMSQLRLWMAFTPPQALQSVPIPIQGHLEGLLAAGFSALDQVANYYGCWDAKELFKKRSTGDPFPAAVRKWYEDPLVRHANKLRNAATHRYYGKLPAGEGPVEGLRVPDYPDVGGPVPVELLAYATEVLEHWARLAGHIGCPLYR